MFANITQYVTQRCHIKQQYRLSFMLLNKQAVAAAARPHTQKLFLLHFVSFILLRLQFPEL